MTIRKIQCFIASAFRRQDVDNIYRQAIVPVLRKLKIVPTRVDRVEHNEDIDDKIFQLLKQADFCIADLTYSRPSVYYEAGYAFARPIPVIYIARSDHFRDTDDDPHGIFRVHFDLQMKNIIDWSSPSKNFQRRLESRILHVTAPLRADLAKKSKLEQFAVAFSRHSQSQQLEILTTTAKNHLKVSGFRIKKEVLRSGGVISRPERFSAIRSRVTIEDFVRFIAVPSVLKKHLDLIDWISLTSPEMSRKPHRIIWQFIYVSLRPASNARIPDALSQYYPIDKRHFRRDFKSTSKNIPTTVYVHIIDAVRSKEEFVEQLKKLFKEYKISAKK